MPSIDNVIDQEEMWCEIESIHKTNIFEYIECLFYSINMTWRHSVKARWRCQTMQTTGVMTWYNLLQLHVTMSPDAIRQCTGHIGVDASPSKIVTQDTDLKIWWLFPSQDLSDYMHLHSYPRGQISPNINHLINCYVRTAMGYQGNRNRHIILHWTYYEVQNIQGVLKLFVWFIFQHNIGRVITLFFIYKVYIYSWDNSWHIGTLVYWWFSLYTFR